MNVPQLLIDGLRPACVPRRRAIEFFGGETKLIARMLWCAHHQPDDPWLLVVRNRERRPGQSLQIDTASLEAAYLRVVAGEEPPLLPSERRDKAIRESTAENPSTQPTATGSLAGRAGKQKLRDTNEDTYEN